MRHLGLGSTFDCRFVTQKYPILMQAHSVKRDQMTLASEYVKVLNGAIWKFELFEAPLLPKLQQLAEVLHIVGISALHHSPVEPSQDEPLETLREKRD